MNVIKINAFEETAGGVCQALPPPPPLHRPLWLLVLFLRRRWRRRRGWLQGQRR